MRKISVVALILFAALACFPRALRGASYPSQASQVEDGTLKNIQGKAKMDGDKMKFVTDDDNKEWNVINPEVFKGHVGQHVEINVHLYPSKGSIHVHTVKKLKD
jgi:hypothetical protein